MRFYFCIIINVASSGPNSIDWSAYLVLEVLFYWVVPIFLMDSGATLMNYLERYNSKTFLKKRFSKTLAPLVVWPIIMYVYKVAAGKMSTANSITSLLNTLLWYKEEYIFITLYL